MAAVQAVAAQCLGYVGADLVALAKEALNCALARLHGKPLSVCLFFFFFFLLTCLSNELQVNAVDFRTAMASIVPSAQREVAVTVPCVRWEDVGGLDHVKSVMREAIEWPLLHRRTPSFFGSDQPRVRSPRTVFSLGCRVVSASGHQRVARHSPAWAAWLLQDHTREGSGYARSRLLSHPQWRRHLRSLPRRRRSHRPGCLQESMKSFCFFLSLYL